MAKHPQSVRFSLLALFVVLTAAACLAAIAQLPGGRAMLILAILCFPVLGIAPWVFCCWRDDVRFQRRARMMALPPQLSPAPRSESPIESTGERAAEEKRMPRRHNGSGWVRGWRSVFVRFKYD